MQDKCIEEQPIRYSSSTILQSVRAYEDQVHAALRVCQTIPGAQIPYEDPTLRRRVGFLRDQLTARDYTWQSDEETRLRGTLLEIVAQQAFQMIVQQSASNSSYEVIFAPPTIFDASTDDRKGGDLLLVKKRKDETYEAIVLIDVTSHSKSRRDLRTGTHDGLGTQNILPVIIVNMTNVEWEDVYGKIKDTRRFLQSVVRRMFRADITDYPCYGLHPDAINQVLEHIRDCVEGGCNRSRDHIAQQGRPQESKRLLESIEEARFVLGKRKDN